MIVLTAHQVLVVNRDISILSLIISLGYIKGVSYIQKLKLWRVKPSLTPVEREILILTSLPHSHGTLTSGSQFLHIVYFRREPGGHITHNFPLDEEAG